MTFSQNGWPASADRNLIQIRNYQVPGSNRYFSCTAAVAPILINFAAEFHKLIEPIDVGTYDDWGYATPVVIPGSTTVSNHGSGTAIDIDATLHPWKVSGTFKFIKVVRLRLLVRKYGIRWGGDYAHGWKDEMHFEIVENQAQVKTRIASMRLLMPSIHK